MNGIGSIQISHTTGKPALIKDSGQLGKIVSITGGKAEVLVGDQIVTIEVQNPGRLKPGDVIQLFFDGELNSNHKTQISNPLHAKLLDIITLSFPVPISSTVEQIIQGMGEEVKVQLYKATSEIMGIVRQLTAQNFAETMIQTNETLKNVENLLDDRFPFGRRIIEMAFRAKAMGASWDQMPKEVKEALVKQFIFYDQKWVNKGDDRSDQMIVPQSVRKISIDDPSLIRLPKKEGNPPILQSMESFFSIRTTPSSVRFNPNLTQIPSSAAFQPQLNILHQTLGSLQPEIPPRDHHALTLEQPRPSFEPKSSHHPIDWNGGKEPINAKHEDQLNDRLSRQPQKSDLPEPLSKELPTINQKVRNLSRSGQKAVSINEGLLPKDLKNPITTTQDLSQKTIRPSSAHRPADLPSNNEPPRMLLEKNRDFFVPGFRHAHSYNPSFLSSIHSNPSEQPMSREVARWIDIFVQLLKEGVSEPAQLKKWALSMIPFLPSDKEEISPKHVVTPWEAKIHSILGSRLVHQGERDQRIGSEPLNRSVLPSASQISHSISETMNQWEAKGMEQPVRESIAKEWVRIINESERLNEFRPVFFQKAMELFLESLSGRLEGPEESKERILMDIRQWMAKWVLMREPDSPKHTDPSEKLQRIPNSDAEKPQTNSGIPSGKKEIFSPNSLGKTPQTDSSSVSDRINPNKSISEGVVLTPTARENPQPLPPEREIGQSPNPTGTNDSMFARERLEPQQLSTMSFLRLMNFSTHTDLATLYTAAFALESFQCRIDWVEKKQYKEG